MSFVISSVISVKWLEHTASVGTACVCLHMCTVHYVIPVYHGSVQVVVCPSSLPAYLIHLSSNTFEELNKTACESNTHQAQEYYNADGTTKPGDHAGTMGLVYMLCCNAKELSQYQSKSDKVHNQNSAGPGLTWA